MIDPLAFQLTIAEALSAEWVGTPPGIAALIFAFGLTAGATLQHADMLSPGE